MRKALFLAILCSLALLLAVVDLVATAGAVTPRTIQGPCHDPSALEAPSRLAGSVAHHRTNRPLATGPDAWVNIVGPRQVTRTQVATFTIQFGNEGDSVATNGAVTLSLSAGLGYAGANPLPTRWEPQFGWDVGDLLPMSTANGIVLSVTTHSFVRPGQALSMSVELGIETMESVKCNNRSTIHILAGYNLFLPCANKAP